MIGIEMRRCIPAVALALGGEVGAMVLAGMAAHGATRIHRIYDIDRGYDRIEQRLNALGAHIERVQE